MYHGHVFGDLCNREVDNRLVIVGFWYCLTFNLLIMNLLAPIESIMTKEVFTLSPKATIADVSDLFASKRIHHIPVIDQDGALVGIVSKSDFLFFRRGYDKAMDKRIEDMRLNSYTVDFIMTKGMATVEPDTRINVVLEIFRENLFHAVPVTTAGKLVGIVTTYDIINQLAADTKAETVYA